MTGEDDWISVSLKNGNPFFSARSICPNLYELPVRVNHANATNTANAVIGTNGTNAVNTTALSSVQFWHEALGHSSVNTWKDTSDRYVDGKLIPSRPSKFFCETCARSNAKNINPAPVHEKTSSEPYDLVHTDLAGPFLVQSLGGANFYMTLIDDHSRYAEIYFLKKKSEAINHLKAFCEKVNTKTTRYPGQIGVVSMLIMSGPTIAFQQA